jgi:hypothetical protein
MTNATPGIETDLIHWVVGGVFAVALGLVILVWPGPISITDRLPFSLILLLPGVFALYHVYAESTGPV